nr:glutamate--tRNA ligase family protein [Hyphomonadaceae bacterium]
ESFGWPVPIYAHIPLIHGDDGKKLSKRHGALGVEEYRAMGYLPESLRAYLLRLGWSHGDLDIVDDATARDLFDLDGLGKSPSRLDFAKLGSVNNHFLRLAEPGRIADLILGQDAAGGDGGLAAVRNRLVAAAKELAQRATTVPELVEQAEFLTISRPFALLPGALKQLTGETRPRLEGAAQALASAKAWRHDALKDTLADYAASQGVGFGKIGPLVRAALTGGRPAPDLGLALEWLGRDESLARLNDALEQMA